MIVQKFPDDDTISFTKETLNLISTSLILNQIRILYTKVKVTKSYILPLRSSVCSPLFFEMGKVGKFMIQNILCSKSVQSEKSFIWRMLGKWDPLCRLSIDEDRSFGLTIQCQTKVTDQSQGSF